MRQFTFLGGMAGFDRNELGQELGFVDVQAASFGIGKTPRSDFSCSPVVKNAGVPGGLDAAARGDDAAARLPGDDDFSDGKIVQVNFMFGRNFGQAERVGWSATDGGNFGVTDYFET